MGVVIGMFMRDHHQIELSNLTLAYQDTGEGKAVVLLHGFCGSHAYFDKIIPTLSEKNRVIVPDLPGHGDSTFPKGNYEMEYMADTLKELLDGLNLDKVTLFGHSLGGYITLAFAEKYEERLHGYSLIHSSAFPDTEEAKEGRDSAIDKVESEGVSALIEGLVPKLFSPDNVGSHARDVEKVKNIGCETTKEGAIGMLKAMKNRPDRNHVLKSSNLPALLIAGEKDQVIPPEKTFSVHKDTISQALIKGAGHMSMMEKPEILISEIQHFLKS
ncbi:alpha/beta fold hydrolase [Paenisporosarcina sp. OV554]|uniref:alpha/beta fold hydrolase n=1 Tax=Paenisporosarcina sp. OV554 TaxID=2135694 RepID=UPI001E569C1F|nr:alpha/beta hydrolase [Paenisporosarcina sp. OV554]